MRINTKTKNKIILGIIITILLIGLGAWFNDFITREKEIKNSPVSYDGQYYIDESYTITEDTGKVTETPEKTTVTDSYSFA